MDYFPDEIECSQTGCINWFRDYCWLQGQPVKDFYSIMEHFSTGEKCQVRHLINKNKIRNLIDTEESQ